MHYDDSNEDVSIAGLDRAEVLAALYNATAPLEMGFLQALNGPVRMSREEAVWLTLAGQDGTSDYPSLNANNAESSLVFDYVNGRPLKVDLAGDSVDSYGYDSRNGHGALATVIDELRQNGLDSPAFDEWRAEALVRNTLTMQSEAVALRFLSYVQSGREMLLEKGCLPLPVVPGFSREDFLFAYVGDKAMKYFDRREPQAMVGAYVMLLHCSSLEALNSILVPSFISHMNDAVDTAVSVGDLSMVKSVMGNPRQYITA